MRYERVNYILIGAVILFLIFLTVGTAVVQDREFSENENRYLAERPKLSVGNLIDGSYEAGAEKYLSDRIILRESWVRLMSGALSAVGTKDVNGAYIFGDGRLAEKISPKDFDFKRYERNLEELKKLSDIAEEGGIAFDTILVPTAAYSLREIYGISVFFDEGKAMNAAGEILGSRLIDVSDRFYGGEKLFFFTDHHWTSRGAYEAYRRYVSACSGKCMPDYENQKLRVVTKDFRGTLYSKVLLESVRSDEITVPEYIFKTEAEFTVGEETYASVFFPDRLEKKDKYEFFLGGNYDKASIRIPANEKKTKLLVIKDSFANALAPYLMEDFREITLVDTRYFRGNISKLMKDGDYDSVLVIYGIGNFAKEKLNLTADILS